MRFVVVMVGLVGVLGCDGNGGTERDVPDDHGDVADADVPEDVAEDLVEVPEDAEDVPEEVASVCGNGIPESGEECDEGEDNSDEPNATCRTSCRSAGCGDGVIDSDEDCDLLSLGDETCATVGYPAGGTLRCLADCTISTSGCRNPTCGSGTCDLGETATNCATDCHDGCGDGSCAEAEDQFTCPADCGAVAIAAGGRHSCVVLVDGTARCWGLNMAGELGDGTNTDSSAPVRVTGLTGAVDISAGGGFISFGSPGGHTCALLLDRTIKCWGWNDSGQLGDGTNTASSVPVAVSGLDGAVSVDAGWSHSCAVVADGTARCWGANDAGQLGDGTVLPGTTPVDVVGVTTARDISAAESHTCAALADGTAACWGNNERGQLGDGTTTDSSVPIIVSGLSRAVGITAAGAPACGDAMHGAVTADGHACAALVGGAVRCWGSNDCGQLGDGTTTASGLPVAVSGITTASAVSAEECLSCSRLADGTAQCWGGAATIPSEVAGLTEVVDLSVAGVRGDRYGCVKTRHTCVLRRDGTASCWGVNSYGQLGNGTTAEEVAVPVQVAAW